MSVFTLNDDVLDHSQHHLYAYCEENLVFLDAHFVQFVSFFCTDIVLHIHIFVACRTAAIIFNLFATNMLSCVMLMFLMLHMLFSPCQQRKKQKTLRGVFKQSIYDCKLFVKG